MKIVFFLIGDLFEMHREYNSVIGDLFEMHREYNSVHVCQYSFGGEFYFTTICIM